MRRFFKFAAIAIALPVGLQAQSGQVVGPNGVSVEGNPTNWHPDVQGGATAQVTSNEGRLGFGNYGSGSLELSVTGNLDQSGQYPDWGFYYRYAESNQGFGSLSDLSRLSFDWYRSAVPNYNNSSVSVDWPYKTPVMRLVLQDKNNQLSELIWEGYYNQNALGNAPTATDTWMTSSNMQDGNFWFNRPPTALGQENIYVGTDCADNNFTFWQGGIPGSALGQLLGVGGCLANADARVVGIAVGVGSQWPHEYHGFVDNVRMGFGDVNGELALDANFDFVSTVPEPSSYALMGVGLLVLGVVTRRRRA